MPSLLIGIEIGINILCRPSLNAPARSKKIVSAIS